MSEKQARTSLERLQKELDRSIASAKRRIDAAYLDALRGESHCGIWSRVRRNTPVWIRSFGRSIRSNSRR